MKNFFYGALYKKPATIIVTILSLGLILVATLELSGRLDYIGMPWLYLGVGTFSILSPSLSVLLAVKKFASIPDLTSNFRYTFGEDNIVVNAKTCDATYKWEHITKVKETKQFLLLSPGAKLAYFIKKDRLTNEQNRIYKVEGREEEIRYWGNEDGDRGTLRKP